MAGKQLKAARVRAAKALAGSPDNEPALEAAAAVVDAIEHLVREVVKDAVGVGGADGYGGPDGHGHAYPASAAGGRP